MKLYNNLPTLDLHGMDRDYAVLKTREFINDNYIMKNERVVIIHGIGSGILRKEVHVYLKHEKIVENYKTDYFNAGSTIVEIKRNG